MPFHDMFNHDAGASLSLRYNTAGMSYSFFTPHRSWAKGQEVASREASPR